MTAVEMVNMFYDVLENTNRAFAMTMERPVVDVVLGYLNEAQITLFNERYLPGDTLTNIKNVKLLRQELGELVSIKDYNLTANEVGTHYKLDEELEGIFVEGYVNMTHELLETSESQFHRTEIIPITLDSMGKFLTNHINAPILLQPVIALGSDLTGNNSTPYLIVDTLTTLDSNEVFITVVNKPTKIIVNVDDLDAGKCKLHERFHEGITRAAVEMYLREKGAFPNQGGEE